VAEYLEDIAFRHKLDIDFQAGKGFGRFDPHIETVLYRVTQEAITNVLRHARSGKVSVVMSRQGNEVSLIIEDDGAGFNPEKIMEDGDKSRLGLRGMRERVSLAGGTLTIESRPGSGTSIFVRIPLRQGRDGNSSR
jgi:signal transduction histidine kinase